MTAKELFQSVRNIDRQMAVKYEQLERLNALATKITPNLSSCGSGGSGGVARSMEDSVAKIIELSEELRAEIEKYYRQSMDAYNVLQQMPDEKQRRCLECYYLLGKSFEQISGEMAYSTVGVKKLRNRALKSADEIMKNPKEYTEVY